MMMKRLPSAFVRAGASQTFGCPVTSRPMIHQFLPSQHARITAAASHNHFNFRQQQGLIFLQGNTTTTQQRNYAAGMFSSVSSKLKGAMESLTKKKTLSPNDVNAAMHNVRLALLQSDVAQEVVDEFIGKIKEEAVGQKAVDQFPKAATVYALVQKHLTELLGTELSPLNVLAKERAVKENKEKGKISIILVAGTQGSGKTTTCAKLAQYMRTQNKILNTSAQNTTPDMKFLLVSLDTHRPAAQEQLARLAQQIDAFSLPINAEERNPVNIVHNTWDYLQNSLLKEDERNDWVIIMDTAGRMQVDQDMMTEIKNVESEIQAFIQNYSSEKYDMERSLETLLVADAMLGNEAVNIAKQFHDQLGLSGIVLTRLDGDARGGAAISMRARTGVPIKLIGTGEHLNAIDVFEPKGLTDRIMGQGDVGAMARRVMAAAAGDSRFSAEGYKASVNKYAKGGFDFSDYLQMTGMFKKMGGMADMASYLPGEMGKKAQQYSGQLDKFAGSEVFEMHSALISHLTPDEVGQPQMLKSSSARRIQIAKNSGVDVVEVNKMLKMFDKFKLFYEKLAKSGVEMDKLGTGPDSMAKLTDLMMKDPELMDMMAPKRKIMRRR